MDDHGFKLYRLHARSELFEGFENTDHQVMLLNILATSMTLSGHVRAAGRQGPDRVSGERLRPRAES